MSLYFFYFFFFQAEDGIRDYKVTGVQTCALPISVGPNGLWSSKPPSSQVMKMAEWLVQARLCVMRPTQVRTKVSPSLYSVACAGAVGEVGNGQAVAPPCMSLQMFGLIQTNCGTLPADRPARNCVSGTTLSARAGFW